MEKHIVTAENAPLISEWMRTRGGIAVWGSLNLSNPGASWTTPFYTTGGKATTKPNWQVGNEPSRHILDPAEILVSVDKEVKRFHVAVRVGSQGLTLKCTDASSARIRREVAKAGDGAYHVFDYGDEKNCVIMAPVKTIPLPEWEALNEKTVPAQLS